MQTNDAVDEAFLKITTKAERHLCGIFDCVLLDGSPDPGYIGRSETRERKWRAVIPPQAKRARDSRPRDDGPGADPLAIL